MLVQLSRCALEQHTSWTVLHSAAPNGWNNSQTTFLQQQVENFTLSISVTGPASVVQSLYKYVKLPGLSFTRKPAQSEDKDSNQSIKTTVHVFQRLVRPTDETKKQHWKSSNRKYLKPHLPAPKYDKNILDKMTSALMDFSFGSAGIMSVKPPNNEETTTAQNPIQPTTSEAKLENSLIDELEELMVVQDQPFPYVKYESPGEAKTEPPLTKSLPCVTRPQMSRICVEELKIPEIMLPALSSSIGIPPSMQLEKDPARFSGERKKFLTTHLAGITRKDQFQKMMDFEESVLKKPELLEKNVRDGHKAVEHLESKLVTRLVSLQSKQPQPGPSFERLQLYSEVWRDLMMDSSIFGSLLSEIKDEYDSYLTHLLDSMKTTNRGELARCLHAMEDLSNEKRATKAESLHLDVENLESLCRIALLRNLDLHERIAAEEKKIEEERILQEEEDEDNIRRMLPVRKRIQPPLDAKKVPSSSDDTETTSAATSKVTTEKLLKALRVNIWDRIDTLNEQKTLLKSSFVPKPLHRNIQHAIKDIELEMQKLQQQSAYLMQHKQELLEHLSDIQSRNIEDKDIREIKRIIDQEPVHT